MSPISPIYVEPENLRYTILGNLQNVGIEAYHRILTRIGGKWKINYNNNNNNDEFKMTRIHSYWSTVTLFYLFI